MMMGLWRLAGLGMQKRFFSKSSAALERGRRSSGPLSISSLTGRLKQDGLTRYELDFMETAEWSIALVERMKNDYKELSGLVRPFEKPQEPLCFEFSQTFDYDYTAPPAPNNGVNLHVRVGALSLSPEELHALKVLAGPAYDPISQMLTLKPSETVGRPPQDVCTAEENVNHLSKSLEKLIELAMTSKDTLKDVPLDLSHLQVKKHQHASLEFPTEWLPSSPPSATKPDTEKRAASA